MKNLEYYTDLTYRVLNESDTQDVERLIFDRLSYEILVKRNYDQFGLATEENLLNQFHKFISPIKLWYFNEQCPKNILFGIFNRNKLISTYAIRLGTHYLDEYGGVGTRSNNFQDLNETRNFPWLSILFCDQVIFPLNEANNINRVFFSCSRKNLNVYSKIRKILYADKYSHFKIQNKHWETKEFLSLLPNTLPNNDFLSSLIDRTPKQSDWVISYNMNTKI